MGKKSNKTVSSTVYGNTTTTNPYVTSQTTNASLSNTKIRKLRKNLYYYSTLA